MRVVLNMMSTLGKKTGVGNYTNELYRCLNEQIGPDETIATYPPGWLKFVQTSRPKTGLSPTFMRKMWEVLLCRHFKWGWGRTSDLYHEPNFTPFPCDQPTAITFHDLSVLRNSDWHPAHRVKHFERHLPNALSQGAHFFTVSEFGRQELIDVLNIPSEKITHTYNGVRPGMQPLPGDHVAEVCKRLQLPGKYLLHVGTLEPRKNLLMLLKAYCSLPASVRDECPLVLVGGWGWNFEPIQEFMESEGKHKNVVQPGFIPDDDLPALYNGARALVYPSFYEGFGLPMVEMMACGGAVISSTADALVEVAGGHAHLIDPLDQDGWRDAMQQIIRDDDWCAKLRQGTPEWAKRFTWDKCASDTLRVYRKLCGRETEQTPLAA